jgi:hypothetical protein
MIAKAPVCFLVSCLTAVHAQYWDGYQNVSSATTPVQVRLAYAGTGMMGTFLPLHKLFYRLKAA